MQLKQIHAEGIGNIIREINMLYNAETEFWYWQYQEVMLLAKGKKILQKQSVFYNQKTKTLQICEGESADTNKLLVLTAYSHFEILSGVVIELPEFSRAGNIVLIMTANSEIRISQDKKLILDKHGNLAVQAYKEEVQSWLPPHKNPRNTRVLFWLFTWEFFFKVVK